MCQENFSDFGKGRIRELAMKFGCGLQLYLMSVFFDVWVFTRRNKFFRLNLQYVNPQDGANLHHEAKLLQRARYMVNQSTHQNKTSSHIST